MFLGCYPALTNYFNQINSGCHFPRPVIAVAACIWVTEEREREGQKERETDRQTNRQRERRAKRKKERQRQTEKHRERETERQKREIDHDEL